MAPCSNLCAILGISTRVIFPIRLTHWIGESIKWKKNNSTYCSFTNFYQAFIYPTFQALPSVVIVLVVGAVLFLGGCGWGWQVQRDRTIIWAVI